MKFSYASPRLFVSYDSIQGAWVKEEFIPRLEGAGADVVVDFRVLGEDAVRVPGDMDGAQDEADVTVCLLTPSYCASDFCMHEMQRGVMAQERGRRIVPVVRRYGSLLDCLGEFDAIQRVELYDTNDSAAWRRLFSMCGIGNCGDLSRGVIS